MLQACAERVGATRGAVYILDSRSGDLVPEITLGMGPRRSALVADRMTIPPTHLGSAADLTCAEAGRGEPSATEVGLAVYACRADACVAIVRLDGYVSPSVIRRNSEALRATASLLLLVYEQRFALNLLDGIGLPLDFGQSGHEFLGTMTEFAATVTGVAYVVLREEFGRTLRCLSVAGFNDDADLSHWDLSPINDYPILARVLTGETLVLQSDQAALALTGTHRHALYSPVRAVVASPVTLDGERAGMVMFGTSARADYTAAELDGFRSVASYIGLAIAALASFTEASERLRVQTEAAAAITAVEIGRSVRHEAKGILDNCQHRLHLMARGLRDPLVLSDINGISDDLVRLYNALSHMHVPGVPVEAKWESTSLRRLWHEATQALAGALMAQRVTVRYAGPDVTVSIVPDQILHVFLNLLLNSIDAFRGAKRRDRRIELRVHAPAEKANDLSIVYSDTATGIDPSMFSLPAGLGEMPLQQLIFEPGVTSKEHGSGFGLWLARIVHEAG